MTINPIFGGCMYIGNVVSAFRMSNVSGQLIVVILLIGSVFAWSIMVTKFAELKAAARNASLFLKAYKGSSHPLALFLSGNRHTPNPLHSVYIDICRQLTANVEWPETDKDQVMLRAKELFTAHQIGAARNLSDQFLSERMLDLERHMGVLATAATVAPFLGLLGTVWGVMDAFGGLAMASSATLSAVAPGVSGALLTTVVGLVVALPSLIGYNVLVGRVRRLTIRAERFVQELMTDIELHFASE